MSLQDVADEIEEEWHRAGTPEPHDADSVLRRDLTRLVLLVDKVAQGMGE